MRTTTVRRGLGLTLFSAMMLVLALSGIAAAQTETYPTLCEQGVLESGATECTDPSTTPTSVGGTSVTVSRGGGTAATSLPFSGGDVALLTVLGLAAVGSGAAIVIFSRRRSTSAAV